MLSPQNNEMKEYKGISLNDAILSLENDDECERFLQDICTPAEKKALHERWRVAQLLSTETPGLSYKQIHEITKVSIATITRVARFLLHESYNGYKLVLHRLHRKREEQNESSLLKKAN